MPDRKVKKIFFTKMQGLGNDFMVINGLAQQITLSPSTIKKLSNRKMGVGFDQLLLIEKAKEVGHDFFYRIFNADGSEVGQCGNGARCVAKFIEEKGLSDKKHLRLQTITTDLSTDLLSDGDVRVNLGVPNFLPPAIPCLAEKLEKHYQLQMEKNHIIEFGAVSLGNPHVVILIDDVEDIPIQTIGAQLARHPFFPEGANVGFMQILSPEHIKLRVYERGVGETLACGSGAAAAVAVGKNWGLLSDKVKVTLRGGELLVSWQGGNKDLYIKGEAVFEYDGETIINDVTK